MSFSDKRAVSSRIRFLLLTFDVPCKSKSEQRAYRRFRRSLIQFGYIQLQESVYLSLIRDYTSVKKEVKRLKETAPKGSDVKLIAFSQKTSQQVITISGNDWPFEALSREIVVITDDKIA